MSSSAGGKSSSSTSKIDGEKKKSRPTEQGSKTEPVTKKMRMEDGEKNKKKKEKKNLEKREEKTQKPTSSFNTLSAPKKLSTKVFTIKEVAQPEREVLPPFIAHFPALPPTPEKVESLTCFENVSAREKSRAQNNGIIPEKLLALETPKMIYSGSSRAVGDLCKYAVAVVDKRDGAIRLAELPHVYTMQHELKFLPKTQVVNGTTATMANQRHALVETFGSRKRLQGLRQALANAVTEDNVSSGQSITKALKEKANSESTDVSTTREDLPVYNLQAASKEEAYPIDGLIAKEDWVHFKEDSKLLMGCFQKNGKTQWEKLEEDRNWPRIVVGHLKNMMENGLQFAERKKIVNLLIYATYLMRFYHRLKTSRDPIFADRLQETATYSSIPEHFIHKFVDLFTESQIRGKDKKVYRSSKSLDARLVNYICISLLISMDFVVNITHVAEDLTFEKDKLLSHFRAVGCSFDIKRGPETKALAKLTVPLTFPRVEKRNKKKR